MHRTLILVSALAFVSGCDAAPTQKAAAPAPPAHAPRLPPAPAVAPAVTPAPLATASVTPVPNDPLSVMAARINQAAFDSNGASASATAEVPPKSDGASKAAPTRATPDQVAIRTQVLLGRARFSPGVVDARQGTNLKHAVAAYQRARDLDETGVMDAATWRFLSAEPTSAQPAASVYTLNAEDVAGPFADDVGEDFVKLAALPNGPQFTTPLEALAERFHMSQALLKALNPDVDLSVAGGRIIVVDDNPPAFAKGDVARVDVSNADASAFAYDKADKLIAFYPATVGSTERPSPSGSYKVVGVARHPTYTYDPSKLKWGPRSAGKLVVKPGPNNPVGSVWIDLNAPSYGVHGTPEPDKIGKTGSHGCVRLTNWDAESLAAGVKPGVVVAFIGQRAKQTRASKKA